MPNNKLEEILIEEIREKGPMDFARFMDQALCHPLYGYYVTRDPLGVTGDFTTAPEISQMFGELIGAWVADVWQKMGAPNRFYFLEVGPGRGTLMSDMLRVATKLEGFREAAQILMMEASPVLRGKQREKLAEYSVKWLDAIDQVPTDAPIIIVGNEFLDTVPIHQVVKTADGWVERVVIEDQQTGKLAFAYEPIKNVLQPYLPRYAKPDQLYEISPIQVAYSKVWAELIKAHGGANLQIDYGHGLTVSGETMRAIRHHKKVDALVDVGLADVTVNVDFEPLMRMSQRVGVSCLPVVRQGDFLKALGIELRAEKLKAKDPEGVEAALRRLVDGDQMGSLFKVFCAYHGLNGHPEGFG